MFVICLVWCCRWRWIRNTNGLCHNKRSLYTDRVWCHLHHWLGKILSRHCRQVGRWSKLVQHACKWIAGMNCSLETLWTACPLLLIMSCALTVFAVTRCAGVVWGKAKAGEGTWRAKEIHCGCQVCCLAFLVCGITLVICKSYISITDHHIGYIRTQLCNKTNVLPQRRLHKKMLQEMLKKECWKGMLKMDCWKGIVKNFVQSLDTIRRRATKHKLEAFLFITYREKWFPKRVYDSDVYNNKKTKKSWDRATKPISPLTALLQPIV